MTERTYFGKPKTHLGGRRFHNNDEVEMSICEWLPMQETNFHGDGIFKLVPGWGKYVNILGGLFWKTIDTAMQQMSYIKTL